jgi:hypothetical protein
MEGEAADDDNGNDGKSGTGTAIVMAPSPLKRRSAAGVVRALAGFTGTSNISSTALACASGTPRIRGIVKSAASSAACAISTAINVALREPVHRFESIMIAWATG